MSKLLDIKIVPEFDPMGSGACCYHLVEVREHRFLFWKWTDETVVGPPFNSKQAAKMAKRRILKVS